MKKCFKCGIEKDESEFHKNKGAKDGLAYQCKKCEKKYREEYYNRPKENLVNGKKKCTKCAIEKNASEFYNDKTRRDGLTSQCKECKVDHPIEPTEVLPVGMKRCSKCKEIKNINEFHKQKSHKDELRSRCKECRKEDSKK
jgi:hypothetical protein